MATILPFLKENVVFGPKDVKAMSMAFDDVCNSLSVIDGRQREAMAERIVALAKQGVRSPTVLRDRLLHEAGLGHRIGLSNGPPTAAWLRSIP
jgi:hypothetical protein